MKTSERAASHLHPRFPRLALLRKRRRQDKLEYEREIRAPGRWSSTGNAPRDATIH